MQRQKQSQEDLEFPDEIETPHDIAARVRFQKYRGLKSFRTSEWDPYENLPMDYSRIFQFQNYKRTRHRIFKEIGSNGVPVGSYVTVYLKNVPISIHSEIQKQSNLFMMFGLLPNEHKMSTLNMVIQRNPQQQDPIKSKDDVIVQCGFRRFVVQPIYSTNTRGGTNNVHKFERFLQQGHPSMATVFAPIQFGPAPVIFFKHEASGMNWTAEDYTPFLGTGTVVDVDPTRIIAKRIILTGHPFKVHKQSATVRFMFFSPEDINYFKPVQLSPKMGRVGHIKESLGTHGYMKCVFDSPIKGQDTVCMNLYKRVFPKWTTRLFVDSSKQMTMEE